MRYVLRFGRVIQNCPDNPVQGYQVQGFSRKYTVRNAECFL